METMIGVSAGGVTSGVVGAVGVLFPPHDDSTITSSSVNE
jgi:hypothetical protein